MVDGVSPRTPVPSAAHRAPLPITVLGGYLGAGKTTLLNSLLAQSTDRRLGVIVNDFGELGIDADTVAGAGGAADVVNLPNGCVCCSLGADLHDTLQVLAAVEPPLDHVVVEASGVADPAATASWGTVPPFVPGGTVVLVACDTIARQVTDRYVGGEVRRQIAGADLVVLTKSDRCDVAGIDQARRLVDGLTDAIVVEATQGDLAADVVLGPESIDRRRDGGSDRSVDETPAGDEHLSGRYVRWSFVADVSVDVADLRRVLGDLPAGVLRLKGTAEVDDSRHAVVQVVGSTVDITLRKGRRHGIRLEAIGLVDVLDPASLDDLARHLV